MPPHQIVQTGAFASQHQHTVRREIELVVRHGAALVESDAPQISLLELFESATEVYDTGDGYVLGCSGGCFDGYWTQGSGAALSEDDTIRACTIGGAQERAEILRVFDAVECEQKSGLGSGEQIFEFEQSLFADDGHYALMTWRFRQFGQVIARFKAQADAGFAADVDDALQALIMPLTGDANVVELTASGAQCLFHRVQAIKNFHPIQCIACCRLDMCWIIRVLADRSPNCASWHSSAVEIYQD